MNVIVFTKGWVTAVRHRFASFQPDHSGMSRMIIALVIWAFSFSLPFGTPRAEEPPLPAKAETPSPTPSPASTRPQLNIPEIPLSIEPPTLVPNASATAPGGRGVTITTKTPPALSQLDAAFQQSPLGQAAEEQRLHLEWRKLENRIAGDPEVVAAKAATTRTKTDFEKRERLRTYYNIYYAHMQALTSDPQIKAYLEGKKAAALEGLAQHRVRPTPTVKPKAGSNH